MTKEEIKKGNKTIAEFMGYVYFERGVRMDVGDCYKDWQDVDVYSRVPIEVDDYPEDKQKYFKDLPNPDFGNEESKRWASNIEKLSWGTLNWDNYKTKLTYDCDWNELMPVVQKCCADIKAMGFDKRGSWNPTHGYVSEIYIMRLDNPIEKVWLEVVKHIKRYKK
jgi:hypothetical protein